MAGYITAGFQVLGSAALNTIYPPKIEARKGVSGREDPALGRTMSEGFNFKAHCFSGACPNSTSYVMINRGFQQNAVYEPFTVQTIPCRKCESTINKIESLYFSSCNYDIQIEYRFFSAGYKIETFHEISLAEDFEEISLQFYGDRAEWQKIIVTTWAI